MTHVHEDSPSTWSIGQLRRHLLHAHDVKPVMAWDIGRLHQVHLEAHAGPRLTQSQRFRMLQHVLDQPEPEEAPMFESHEHGDIGRFHDRTDRRSVAYHLDEAHGIPREAIDLREIYQQHASLHPMKDTTPPAPEEKVEGLAQRLYERERTEGVPAQPNWDDLGQETRDHYRDRARTALAAVLDFKGAKKIAAERVNQPTEEGQRRILEDRLICAMAGLDFDRDWVPDNGLGPHGRGALRSIYQPQAKKLLRWLRHGGAMVLPNYASLGEDLERERALVMDLEQANNRLRQQLNGAEASRVTLQEANDRQAQAITELEQQLNEAGGEREALRESMNNARAERNELRGALQQTTEERDAIQAMLRQVQTGNQRNVGSIDALEADLAEIRAQEAAHSGLSEVTTRDLLAEVTRRIDLGHCGLDYPVVIDQ